MKSNSLRNCENDKNTNAPINLKDKKYNPT